MKIQNIISVLALLGLLGFTATDAFAKSKDHGKNNGQGQGYEHSESILLIDIFDRTAIHNYLGAKYQGHCPPGLAKKNNGCMPPGQAKKYRVGDRLPDDVIAVPVPRDLLDILSPLPRGYYYAQVDKDVLLIAEASKKVIDAVTLLSALD
jgi:hypothetical protein